MWPLQRPRWRRPVSTWLYQGNCPHIRPDRRSTVTDGALVTANQPTALATIQQLSSMYVDVTQSSSELLILKRNLASGLLKTTGQPSPVKLLLEDAAPIRCRVP